MYKSKLQELCHRRLWKLPDYQTIKEGPDHNPRYVSTVTVNGIDFQTPAPCRNAKESQNNAAKLAVDHFSCPKTSSLPNPPSSSSSQTSNSPSVLHPSLPEPSPTPPTASPQPSFSQTSNSPSVSHPSLPQPSPTPPTPSPQPSFSQPSFPQTSISPSASHPSPVSPTPSPQLSFPQTSNSPSVSHPSPTPPSLSPELSFPQTSNSPCVSHPSLPQPSPTRLTPSPHLSFWQPSFPQTSNSPSVSHPSLPQLSATPPTATPQLSFSQPSFPQTSFSLPQLSALVTSDSSASGTDVDEVLPTVSVMQPKLQDVFQATQINKPITSSNDNMTAGNQRSDLSMQRLYKNQLQTYAQKRNLTLPVYSTEREGPSHASRFKCKVTIDGQTYESPGFFPTVKDAEHAAAKVALMSLSLSGTQEDDIGLYKNLLQELVQKEGFHLPVYSTRRSGEAHAPIFVSNVEIEGELFTGQEAKTKKQAEMSAAKVAYTILKERKDKSNQSSSILLSAHQGKGPASSSPSSDSNVHHANLKSPTSYSPGLVTKNQSGKDKDCAEVKSHHAAIPSSEPIAVTGGINSSSSDITASSVDVSPLSNVQSSPSIPNSNNPAMISSGIASTAASTSTRRKVTVYSSKTNVQIAQGGTLLPISDENWVAYSYPESEFAESKAQQCDS